MSNAESSTQAEYSQEVLLKTITKLLDKAGKDPRLTPRLLREKAEQRMTLEKGKLKPKREKIKRIICDWWEKQYAVKVDKDAILLKSLIKLARVSGNTPRALQGLQEMVTTEEKINTLRQRLRAKGLAFSDEPTESEIAKAEKDYRMKQDMDGIDPSLVMSASKKRNAGSSSSSSGVPIKQARTEVTASLGSDMDGVPSGTTATAVIKKEGSTSSASGGSSRSDGGAATELSKILPSGQGGGALTGNVIADTAHPAPALKRPIVADDDEEAEF
mmetsp:Transcript_8747/g.14558  ORF Transcript_8747/g.14558 Transcript_8747/m.14558 type:complete len:273 (-) Transcript_8747:221-1039(-)